MKNTYLTLLVLISFCFLSSVLQGHKTGADPGFSGDKASGYQNCTFCHNDNLETYQAGMITSNIPLSGYLPDSTYTITATISYVGLSKFGFEISPQDSNGGKMGTMTIGGSDMQIDTSGRYITHTIGGNSGTNSRSWTFTWKAPSTGKGTLTFYGAFNAADGDNTDEGDNIYLSTLVVNDATMPVSFAATTTQNNGCYNLNNGSASVTPLGGTSPYTYKWSNSQGIITGAIGPSISGRSPDTYTCTITDSHIPTPNTCIKTIILENPIQLTASTGSQTNVLCRGESTGTASINANGGTGIKSFLWTPGGASSSSTTGLAAGNYVIAVTDENNCSTSVNLVITQPASSLTLSTTTFSGMAVVNASGGTPPYSFSWSPTGGNSDTAKGLSPGTYTVTVTDHNGCTATKSVVVETTGFAWKEDLRKLISVFPNPGNGEFSIEISASKNEIYAIELMNASGQILFNQTLESGQGINSYHMNWSAFPNGLYILKVNTEKGIIGLPVFIEN